MPFGTEVGIGRRDIVLDGRPSSPSPKGAQPPTSANVRCARPNGWMDQDATWYGG